MAALRRAVPDFRVDRKKLMSQRAAWQSLITEQLRQHEPHPIKDCAAWGALVSPRAGPRGFQRAGEGF